LPAEKKKTAFEDKDKIRQDTTRHDASDRTGPGLKKNKKKKRKSMNGTCNMPLNATRTPFLSQ